MRTKLFLATILALAPMPALADVTARYNAGGKELVIEVDDGGNSRLDVGGKFTIIHRDGVDYIAVTDKEGTKVFELQAMVDLVKGFIPKSEDPKAKEFQFGIAPGTAAVVAGQQGEAWKLLMLKGDEASKKKHIEMVVSADPRLTPVGNVFRRAIDTVNSFFGAMFPEETGFSARLTELFAKGTPLRVTPIEEGAAKQDGPLIEFKSLDTAEIDAKHFELPAPVTSADEIFGAMDALMKPNAGGAIKDLP
ncbi:MULTISPECIES: hypothetical protein [Sphingomonas]|uniref:DUF4412 domain-containing protein n=1 Tax=Sphingomonas kyeonggiensis TaxID=1268553 RepID=A0A7W7JYC1_9SPHN|nr:MULTISPECIES: hypothetical protein [Sphingomonas]MBB4837504.1 hypothetical protein [Sphingomonas kyeonggiensis]WHU01961.1 hypothetical protein O3305_17460 [Sphingomonas sp. NIBR02145]